MTPPKPVNALDECPGPFLPHPLSLRFYLSPTSGMVQLEISGQSMAVAPSMWSLKQSIPSIFNLVFAN
jgi:hypothetical protein